MQAPHSKNASVSFFDRQPHSSYAFKHQENRAIQSGPTPVNYTSVASDKLVIKLQMKNACQFLTRQF